MARLRVDGSPNFCGQKYSSPKLNSTTPSVMSRFTKLGRNPPLYSGRVRASHTPSYTAGCSPFGRGRIHVRDVLQSSATLSRKILRVVDAFMPILAHISLRHFPFCFCFCEWIGKTLRLPINVSEISDCITSRGISPSTCI